MAIMRLTVVRQAMMRFGRIANTLRNIQDNLYSNLHICFERKKCWL